MSAAGKPYSYFIDGFSRADNIIMKATPQQVNVDTDAPSYLKNKESDITGPQRSNEFFTQGVHNFRYEKSEEDIAKA